MQFSFFKENPHHILLFTFMVIAVFLRFYHLGEASLWSDELYSWAISNYSSIDEVIKKGVVPDVHPPGYQILLYFVETYIGDDPFSLRLVSAISGSLSVFLIYVLAKKLYGVNEGLIASGLMCFSYPAIFYSQEARAYALLILFSILSSIALVEIFKKMASENINKPKLKWLLMYVISAIFLSYLHYFGLILVAVQGGICLLIWIKWRNNFLVLAVMFSLIFICYIPWLPTLFEHMAKEKFWIPPPSVSSFFTFLKFSMGGNATLVLFLIFSIASITKVIKSPIVFSISNETQFLLLWLITPLFLVFFKSIFSTSIWTDRNLLILLPALYIALARIITISMWSDKTKKWFSSLCILTMALMLIFYKSYYSKPQKQQIKESVQYVIKNSSDITPKIPVVAQTWNVEYINYYFSYFNSDINVSMPLNNMNDLLAVNKMLEKRSIHQFWLIEVGHHPVFSSEFKNRFVNDFKLIKKQTFLEVSVVLYESRRTLLN